MTVPKWPDFELGRRQMGGKLTYWVGKTDTGRPVTPIFTKWMPAGGIEDEELARKFMRAELDSAFKQAHPNGCPGRKAERGELESQPPE